MLLPAACAIFLGFSPAVLFAASPGETVAVARPALSAQAAAGDGAFQRLCGECHGPNAGGSNRGPPLIHRIYAPNHHADFSFLRAASTGGANGSARTHRCQAFIATAAAAGRWRAADRPGLAPA